MKDIGAKIGGARKDLASQRLARGLRKPKAPAVVIPEDAVMLGKRGWRARFYYVPYVTGFACYDIKRKDWEGKPRRVGHTSSGVVADVEALAAGSLINKSYRACRPRGSQIYYLSPKKSGGLEVDMENDRAFPSMNALRDFVANNRVLLIDELPVSLGESILTVDRYNPKVERVGQDWLQGRHAGSQDFLETLDMRGVEFGKCIRDHQNLLDQAYLALRDLAQVMQLPASFIGLSGELAISFGSRGHGGKAMASYFPSRAVFNLTKNSGAGAIAHEWAHALDHHIARAAGFANSDRDDQGVFLTNGVVTYASEHTGPDNFGKLALAVRSVMNVIRASKDYSKSARLMDRARSTKYWSTPRELFARAFEAFVEDELATYEGNNQFLVCGAHNEGFKDSVSKPYPVGDERRQINRAIRELLATIQTHLK